METKNSISIKRSIAIKAVVTPTWKEDAEKARERILERYTIAKNINLLEKVYMNLKDN